MEQRPKISVVIPVRNEITALGALFDSLASQEFDPTSFEVIVADGCSDDGTTEFVKTFAINSPMALYLVENPRIRSSAGRNVGIAKASGDFIVFIDGHCHLPSRTLLRDTLYIFESSKADCLCRPQPLIASTRAETGRVIAAARASLLGHGRNSLIYKTAHVGFVDPASSGASYRRRIFESIGTFDERYDACEDVDFNIRLRKFGMISYTDPRLTVCYHARSTMSALLVQMCRYGRGRIRLAAKHPDEISLSCLAPLFLLLLIVFSPVFIVTAPGDIPGMIGLGILVVYVAMVVCASVQLARVHGARFLWQAPTAYLAIHLGLGGGMLAEILSMRWTRFRRSVS